MFVEQESNWENFRSLDQYKIEWLGSITSCMGPLDTIISNKGFRKLGEVRLPIVIEPQENPTVTERLGLKNYKVLNPSGIGTAITDEMISKCLSFFPNDAFHYEKISFWINMMRVGKVAWLSFEPQTYGEFTYAQHKTFEENCSHRLAETVNTFNRVFPQLNLLPITSLSSVA